MVVTRSLTKILPDQAQRGNMEQHRHESVTRPLSTSSHSSRSSATAAAKKLAVEAQHARHLAQLEIAELEITQSTRTRKLELERKTAELEMRAELAAIDAEKSTRSLSDNNRSVREWLEGNGEQFIVNDNTTAVLSNKFEIQSAHEIQVEPQYNASFYPQETHRVRAPHSASHQYPTTSLPNNGGDRVPAPDNMGHACMTRLIEVLESITKRDGTPTKTKHFNISLPVFDGKSALDWLMFKRSFFDTEGSYSTVENLARLNQALKGAAREAVSTLLVMAQQASDVIEALDRRFGRPEEIVVHEVNSIRALPKLGYEIRDLNLLATRVRNCVEVAKLLEHHDYLRSPELFGALLNKLPHLLRTRWFDYAKINWIGQSKVELLSNFLSNEVDLVMQFGFVTEATTSSHRERAHAVSESGSGVAKKASGAKNIHKEGEEQLCAFCTQTHLLSECDKFKAMSVDDRWHFIKGKKICYRCLKGGSHSFKFCNKNKTNCQIKDCNQKHHTLLHNSNYNRVTSSHISETLDNEPSTSSQQLGSSEQAVINTAATPQDSTLRPLLKIVEVTVSGPSGNIDTFALLDDGSTATFIDSEIANQIGAKGQEARIHLDCVGGLSRDSVVQYVDFQIKGKHTSETFLVRRARSIKNLGLLRQSATQASLNPCSHLSGLTDKLCYLDAKPTLVIGLDNWHLSIASDIRRARGTKTQPVAIKTVLGWVVFGCSNSRTKTMECVYHASDRSSADPRQDVEMLIKEQYKLEAIGISKYEPRSIGDQRALKILSTTARQLPSGHFEVGLLWKDDNPTVPDSYPLALARFKSLERQMLRDPQYAERYRQNMRDNFDKGYAEQCTLESHSVCWYLPHFGVVNPNKPSKVRIVHDAAAKSHGVSLNSLLLPGPDYLQSLLGILMRFREGKVALTADIKEMFPQVKIREADRDAQRFLWRDDPSTSIKTYRMSSMIFGACSSPSTAIFIVNLNASKFQNEFPKAVRAITTDTYMDDYIGSVDTVEEAASLAADITKIHEHGGFNMRGWISNAPGALNLLPSELCSDVVVGGSPHQVGLELGSTTFTRTLGLVWQPTSDIVCFNIGLQNPLPNQLTKRVVLAQVMRIYDPLGILAPLVTKGRILFQNLWRKGLDWDECLSEADRNEWLVWYDSLNSLVDLQVPRCYNLSEYKDFDLELHVFCDASELAYVAVAYWRLIFGNGGIKLALIGSKARVSPLKPASIPHLELQGALIATRLASFICNVHRYQPSRRYFWCDSMTVLGWLRSDARNYKPFVSHRVGEIIESSEVSEWRWVPSELNVADDATRGKLKTLNVNSRWINGPSFLLSPSSEWPCESQNVVTTLQVEELKPSIRLHPLEPTTFTFASSEAINFNHTRQLPSPALVEVNHFSSWIRMLRATARLHQFIAIIFLNRGHTFVNPMIMELVNHFQTKHDVRHHAATASATLKPIDAEAIHRAEVHALMKSQMDSFGEELRCLFGGRNIPRKSRLFTLSPRLTEKGLIYLCGRITAATDVEMAVKRPIILDGKHPIVRLLITHFHIKFAHGNTETVVNELRQQYWILGLRNAIRSIIHNCQTCKLLRATTMQPPMGDLPEARLLHHRKPFSITGLDYFGPLQVVVGRRREKRWVALFTCMVTRAVHLEVVYSLSSDSAIMCLRRFIARRGAPDAIYSDNGTAFVGANRQLRELSNSDVTDFAANHKIIWHFIPPSAPFMGGAWERLVKSIKTALRVTLHERAPRDETLITLLAEAESVVNTRPLTHVSPDADYPEAITPNHFLLGEPSRKSAIDVVELSDSVLCGRSSWRKALRLADHFWRRWVREYLPTLAPRPVLGTTTLVKVGDPVLIGDGELPRGTWPRGVIEALYPGRDGVVRVVDVRTQAGLLRRPLKKLVPL